MGQKVHPYGFRLGVIKTWNSKWFEDKAYAKWLHEDIRIKRAVKEYLMNANIAGIEVSSRSRSRLARATSSRRPAKPGRTADGTWRSRPGLPRLARARATRPSGPGETRVIAASIRRGSPHARGTQWSPRPPGESRPWRCSRSAPRRAAPISFVFTRATSGPRSSATRRTAARRASPSRPAKS